MRPCSRCICAVLAIVIFGSMPLIGQPVQNSFESLMAGGHYIPVGCSPGANPLGGGGMGGMGGALGGMLAGALLNYALTPDSGPTATQQKATEEQLQKLKEQEARARELNDKNERMMRNRSGALNRQHWDEQDKARRQQLETMLGLPQFKSIDPFGDFLFHGVPIKPVEGKLVSRHLDSDGLAARAEEWAKALSDAQDQAREIFSRVQGEEELRPQESAGGARAGNPPEEPPATQRGAPEPPEPSTPQDGNGGVQANPEPTQPAGQADLDSQVPSQAEYVQANPPAENAPGAEPGHPQPEAPQAVQQGGNQPAPAANEPLPGEALPGADGMRPHGTPFFGLGGGPGGPVPVDAGVVDLTRAGTKLPTIPQKLVTDPAVLNGPISGMNGPQPAKPKPRPVPRQLETNSAVLNGLVAAATSRTVRVTGPLLVPGTEQPFAATPVDVAVHELGLLARVKGRSEEEYTRKRQLTDEEYDALRECAKKHKVEITITGGITETPFSLAMRAQPQNNSLLPDFRGSNQFSGTVLGDIKPSGDEAPLFDVDVVYGDELKPEVIECIRAAFGGKVKLDLTGYNRARYRTKQDVGDMVGYLTFTPNGNVDGVLPPWGRPNKITSPDKIIKESMEKATRKLLMLSP